uniref:dTDP-4-dehydrorhamnose 3,5-epimerase and related enzyme n=1 Tax=uncultured haloarchaeon TaxID=160804 RepID=A5YSP1_9EURY|nr:dTDP-4-dehydrorhamnose 3,5-epimerase and related enzyme [uncultured haloarchaeon]
MIHDVEVRSLQKNVDERGQLTEIWRSDWDFYAGDDEPKMSYFSETHPGIIRAWHRHHRGQIDHFVVPRGKAKVGIYDDREESPTQGEVDTYIVGEGNANAIRVPGDCWHGFKAVGDERVLLLNFPTNLYDYDDPDEERIPYDTDTIPLDWEEPPHK